jgi:hypothetical protein
MASFRNGFRPGSPGVRWVRSAASRGSRDAGPPGWRVRPGPRSLHGLNRPRLNTRMARPKKTGGAGKPFAAVSYSRPFA